MTGIVRNQHSAFRDKTLLVRTDNMVQRDYRMILRSSNRVYRDGRLTFTGITTPLVPLVPPGSSDRNYLIRRRRRP